MNEAGLQQMATFLIGLLCPYSGVMVQKRFGSVKEYDNLLWGGLYIQYTHLALLCKPALTLAVSIDIN